MFPSIPEIIDSIVDQVALMNTDWEVQDAKSRKDDRAFETRAFGFGLWVVFLSQVNLPPLTHLYQL